jgi:putative phosphonate metabolism protein
MTGFPRYAIYYAPPRGSTLDRFGAELLGYDAWTGEELPFPEGLAEAVPDWREVTRDPRKYGFHATLKAPFALAPGKTEAELIAACAAFAGEPRVIPSFRPVADSISGFIAVIPVERSAPLEALAADCVTAFDRFRAPLTERDRARRSPNELTERQRDHLERWGYPYVMEEFRFHMTLTGRLDAARRWSVLDMLRARFAATAVDSLAVDRIALFRQDAAEVRFRIVGNWPLAAIPTEPSASRRPNSGRSA